MPIHVKAGHAPLNTQAIKCNPFPIANELDFRINARQCTLQQARYTRQDECARSLSNNFSNYTTGLKVLSRSKSFSVLHTPPGGPALSSKLLRRNAIYKNAANIAPAKPRAAPPALMWAPAPAELEDLAPEEVPLAAEPDPAAAVPEPAADVGVALMMDVIDPDMETVTVPLPYGTVFKPVERPAGKEAARGWDVTTAGWDVTAT
jgi:hypothetical protein